MSDCLRPAPVRRKGAGQNKSTDTVDLPVADLRVSAGSSRALPQLGTQFTRTLQNSYLRIKVVLQGNVLG